MVAIAQYDPELDKWVPKVVDGVEVTSNVVNDILQGGPATYSLDVMSFVYSLSEDEQKMLCATFPDEIMEESNG